MKKTKWLLITLSISLFSTCLYAQNPFLGFENLFSDPKSYTLNYSPKNLKIDGEISNNEWINIKWSEYFVDIEGDTKPAPKYKTRVKMMWNEQYLYVAAHLEEAHIWANKKPEKDIVFKDNVFKVFIDSDNNMNDYVEIQINPQNEMLFLIMNKPYRDGGAPISGWKPIGIESAVKIDGTINSDQDVDRSWTIEMAIPLSAFNFNPKEPKQNTQLRINFLRTNFDFEINNGIYSKALDTNKKPLPPYYSCWTPQGLINMQYPERWGYTIFSDKTEGNENETPQLAYTEKQRKYLWSVYYKQKEFFKKNKSYAINLNDLGIYESSFIIDGKNNLLQIEATKNQFLVHMREENSQKSISLNQDGLIIN